MILIGQYDSPFVRRVAIALTLHGLAFEHRPWSVFGDAEALGEVNPLRRVPTLVLEGGETLIESAFILDAVDEMAGPGRGLIPPSGPARRAALKLCAMGAGLADKAVALVYERALHQTTSAVWIDRCRGQVRAVLAALEADRAGRPGPWWFGDTLGHGDIAVACGLRFLAEAHADVFDLARWPALAAHAAAGEALPAFQANHQPFVFTPPPGG